MAIEIVDLPKIIYDIVTMGNLWFTWLRTDPSTAARRAGNSGPPIGRLKKKAKSWETHGKMRGKSWENAGKMMGNHYFNGYKLAGKVHGNQLAAGVLMEIYNFFGANNIHKCR
jgi:hypothetical protein